VKHIVACCNGRGRVIVDGGPSDNSIERSHRAAAGMAMYSFAALFDSLTVAENVALACGAGPWGEESRSGAGSAWRSDCRNRRADAGGVVGACASASASRGDRARRATSLCEPTTDSIR